MLVIMMMINTSVSLCSANTTSLCWHCRIPSPHIFRVLPLSAYAVACEEEEWGMPVTFQDFYLKQALSLSLWGFFPEALLSPISELILPPFCVTFASIGG